MHGYDLTITGISGGEKSFVIQRDKLETRKRFGRKHSKRAQALMETLVWQTT